MMFIAISSWNVLMTFCLLCGLDTTSPVNNTCATVQLYSPKNLSYMNISSHCPTAASACFFSVSCGRSVSPNLPTPTPIAPEVTRMISRPEFCRSLSTLHRDSIRRKLILPFS